VHAGHQRRHVVSGKQPHIAAEALLHRHIAAELRVLLGGTEQEQVSVLPELERLADPIGEVLEVLDGLVGDTGVDLAGELLADAARRL
jgi:hypothetical protein